MKPSPDSERRFITYLAALAGKTETGEARGEQQKNLAALAALRRGLGKRPGDASEMFPYVVPFLADRMPERRQDDYFLVASLFAAHQLIWRRADEQHERTNLGASFRRLASVVESGSIGKRFVAMLNAERVDLPDHLRHAISLLRAHDIPVDWLQLLRDLRGWDWESRAVQRSWALAYWGDGVSLPPTSTPTSAQPSAGAAN